MKAVARFLRLYWPTVLWCCLAAGWLGFCAYLIDSAPSQYDARFGRSK